MSDRSRYSPERRALFLALGALGAGLRPVLAFTGAERDDKEGGIAGRPPIIIKGGSFFVELDDTETKDFTASGSGSGYDLPPLASTKDLTLKVIGFTDDGIEFKVTQKEVSDVVLTLTPRSGTPQAVTLSAKGTSGLAVRNVTLEKANDGPAGRRRRLKHSGFGADVGFWISRVEVKKGTKVVFAHEDPELEYRLKILLNE